MRERGRDLFLIASKTFGGGRMIAAAAAAANDIPVDDDVTDFPIIIGTAKQNPKKPP